MALVYQMPESVQSGHMRFLLTGAAMVHIPQGYSAFKGAKSTLCVSFLIWIHKVPDLSVCVGCCCKLPPPNSGRRHRFSTACKSKDTKPSEFPKAAQNTIEALPLGSDSLGGPSGAVCCAVN